LPGGRIPASSEDPIGIPVIALDIGRRACGAEVVNDEQSIFGQEGQAFEGIAGRRPRPG
jgi:hypothetical protein